MRTGLEHLRWRPTVSGGQVIQFQTGDEREYPIGFCKEYAKAAGETLAQGGTFVEVLSGPNAPLSVCVGNEMGVPVPGQKLEKRGEGDRRELQSLAQILGSDPLPGKSVSLGEHNSNDPHRADKKTVVEVQANARPCQDVKNLNRSTAIQAARQPGYGKRVQLIADGLHDLFRHVERALQLRHPFNEENALKSDHQDALDGMATVEVMAVKHRMRVLGQWKSLAECKEVQTLQAKHEELASGCAKKLGRKPRTALMEHLGRLYQVEDTAVPILCLTGMPIVGKALESPFFYSYHVPAAVTVAELLKSAPLRRSSTLRRVKTMAESGTAEMAQAIWKKTLKEVDAGYGWGLETGATDRQSGKFGFLCSTLFGKVGRCCTQSIRARQYGNPDEVALTRELRISLRLMELFVTSAPHRQLKLDHDLPPLILYTDASDVPGRLQGRWVVGAVLVDPNPMTIYYTSWIVPPSVVSSFLPKETYMGQLEILAAPIALNTWPNILRDRQVLLFIDNDAAAACLVRGYSPRHGQLRLGRTGPPMKDIHNLYEDRRSQMQVALQRFETVSGGQLPMVKIQETELHSTGSYGHPNICRRPCILCARGNCKMSGDCGFCHLPHVTRAASFDKQQREFLRGNGYWRHSSGDKLHMHTHTQVQAGWGDWWFPWTRKDGVPDTTIYCNICYLYLVTLYLRVI
eukprot:s4039_g5.t1